MWKIGETALTHTLEPAEEIVSPAAPTDPVVSAVDVAAAGLRRLEPPPRRMTTPQVLKLLEAGTPGRPIARRLLLSGIALLLGLMVLLPDWVYSWYPTYELPVIDVTLRTSLVDAVIDLVPFTPRAFVATYRVPSGEVQEGAISSAEYDAIRAGDPSIVVHMTAGSRNRARPASGLFGFGRLAFAGFFVLFALMCGVGALRRIVNLWWRVRVAKRGIETVGRVTEMHSDRLVRGQQPVGWIYTLYYVFGAATATTVEGAVKDFHSSRYLPFDADRPLRLLYTDKPPFRSFPADLLPLSPRKR